MGQFQSNSHSQTKRVMSSASTATSRVEDNIITPPSAARGGLKENGQNPDSGSKNSENQNNDGVS